jgi:hypothetical protein
MSKSTWYEYYCCELRLTIQLRELRFVLANETSSIRPIADMQGVFYLNQALPFGGVKASGHGRFGQSQSHLMTLEPRLTLKGGEEGLRSLCTPKSVIRDRLFSLIRTPIPKVVGKFIQGVATCDHRLIDRLPAFESCSLLEIPAWTGVDCIRRSLAKGCRDLEADQRFSEVAACMDRRRQIPESSKEIESAIKRDERQSGMTSIVHRGQ